MYFAASHRQHLSDANYKRWSANLMSRFFAKIDKANGPNACWPWTGQKNKAGYGRLMVNRKRVNAHRLAWQFEFGIPPKHLFVCHHCDTPCCCNPRHLFLGTALENTQDCIRKGRFTSGLKDRVGSLHPSSKHSDKLRDAILSEYVPWKITVSMLAKRHNVTKPFVRAVIFTSKYGTPEQRKRIKTGPKYPEQLRRRIVNEFKPFTMTIPMLSKKHGVPWPTIRNWIYASRHG